MCFSGCVCVWNASSTQLVHCLGNIYKSLVFMPTLIMRASDFGFWLYSGACL